MRVSRSLNCSTHLARLQSTLQPRAHHWVLNLRLSYRTTCPLPDPLLWLSDATRRHLRTFVKGIDRRIRRSQGGQFVESRFGAVLAGVQSVQNKRLDGGDTMLIEERAQTTLPQGKYVAVATLRSTNFPMTESSSFELR